MKIYISFNFLHRHLTLLLIISNGVSLPSLFSPDQTGGGRTATSNKLEKDEIFSRHSLPVLCNNYQPAGQIDPNNWWTNDQHHDKLRF